MADGDDYFSAPRPRPPWQLTVARVLMFAVAAITVVALAGTLVVLGVSRVTVAVVLWSIWPAAGNAVLAYLAPRGGPVLYGLTIAWQCVYAVLALAAVGNGDSSGFTQLVVPLVVLVLAVLPPVRRSYLAAGAARRASGVTGA